MTTTPVPGPVDRSLAALRPDLLDGWHTALNRVLGYDPGRVTVGSSVRAWWLCRDCGHEWQTRVAHRVNGSGCPACQGLVATADNNLTVAAPDWLTEWDTARNDEDGITPSLLLPRSNRKVWWRCAGCGWGWRASPDVRHRGHGCPACSGLVATPTHNLAVAAPDWLTEWDTARNDEDGITPSLLLPRSNRKVWWRCQRVGHLYDASPAARQRGGGCPFCAGRRVDESNCLAACAPDVAADWHPGRNGDLTPADVTVGASVVVWWRCPVSADHDWEAPVYSRTTSGSGCPTCAGKVPGTHNRLDLNGSAVVLEEWHPGRNGDLTPADVTVGSAQVVWWRCSVCAHDWEARIIDRTSTRPTGCPRCAPVTRSRTEIAITCELAHLYPGQITPERPALLDLGEPRPTSVDVLHESARVVVEYDGSYTHASAAHADRDTRKSRLLREHGYRVLRVRAATLPALPDDIETAVEIVGDTKATVNNILARLAELEWLTSPHADAYLARDTCAAATRADLIWAALPERERFTPRAARHRQRKRQRQRQRQRADLAGHWGTLF